MIEHFWGALSITHRLGLRDIKSFHRYYARGWVFAFKRRDPRNPRRIMWYTNSDLMAKCEIARCQFQLKEFLDKQQR